jgi:hypothetical protein
MIALYKGAIMANILSLIFAILIGSKIMEFLIICIEIIISTPKLIYKAIVKKGLFVKNLKSLYQDIARSKLKEI